MIELLEVRAAEEYGVARQLFEEYARIITEHLCFQRFAEELEALPLMYGAPTGALLLARSAGQDVGCVGIRRLDEDACEMKRLYVKPAFRGLGIGKRLVEAAVAQAQLLGYSIMRLDTLDTMAPARALYEAVGFQYRTPYNRNISEHVRHMERALHRQAVSPGMRT
ncbi:MAG TPA: GNAT family N-acetyltransferase [Rhodothermales bacterium]|nr:GNAT family N-acetyltransferase [Rhodothermales bacterium]